MSAPRYRCQCGCANTSVLSTTPRLPQSSLTLLPYTTLFRYLHKSDGMWCFQPSMAVPKLVLHARPGSKHGEEVGAPGGTTTGVGAHGGTAGVYTRLIIDRMWHHRRRRRTHRAGR